MSEPVLDVRLVRRIHDGLTIDVGFTLARETAVLFGRSGAGKSTLLRMIAGMVQPDQGKVTLDGRVLFDSASRTRMPLRHRRVGLIFQDDQLFPHLRVDQNVRFGLKSWNRDEADARLTRVVALCGIEHLLTRSPSTLSGGERQRVGLARALAPRPRLLLCDEPVSALDLEARHALIDRILAIQRVEPIPILYVTHNIDEAIAVGQRMFRLAKGRIVASGEPLEVLAASVSGEESTWNGMLNVFPGHVRSIDRTLGQTTIDLDGGPALLVPLQDLEPGRFARVAIRSDEVVLATGPISGISARNVIPGVVARVVGHGSDAEVVVQTGGVNWVVSVVASAVAAMDLNPGREVRMIIKSRSCLVLRDAPGHDASVHS
jgi:molybdate transport system ATP-binding protein